jgi:hypothetical protein
VVYHNIIAFPSDEMSAQVANPIRRSNAWEKRERIKAARRKSESLSPSAGNPLVRRGRRLDRSSSDGKVSEQDLQDEGTEIPPAFRTFIRSKSQEQRLKRAGKRVVTRRSDGTAAISRTKLRERQSRKSDILESFAKYGLDDSVSGDLLYKPARPKPTTETIDSYSDDERSLDPASVHNKLLAGANKMQEGSYNRSLGGSDRGHGSSEYFNRSLDLSSHAGFRNTQGDINTSASDDQWARFKLLGRIGLGEIQPSEAAKHMIRHNVRVITEIIKNIVALRNEDDDIVSQSIHNQSVEIKTGKLLVEVREAVEIRKTRAGFKRDPQSIKLSSKILSELEDFVTVISFMYRGK